MRDYNNKTNPSVFLRLILRFAITSRWLTLTLFLPLVLLSSCGNSQDEQFSIDESRPLQSLNDSCGATEQFRAGQTTDIGNISITNDNDYLYVTLQTKDGWSLKKTHVNISDNLDDVPKSSGGAPINGHFTVQTTHTPSVKSFTYSFLLSDFDFDGEQIYVLTHAEATLTDSNGNEVRTETAYGGNNNWPFGKRWAYYSLYTLCDEPPAPPKTYIVSGNIFFDENENGSYDSEFGIEGTKVELFDANNQLISTTIADNSGAYTFVDLLPGEYTVIADSEENLKELDSTTGGNIEDFIISDSDTVIDFGYELPTISGVVFYDITENQNQDVDELGMTGVLVYLLNNNDEVIETISTDSSGNYEFQLYPGTYTVAVEFSGGLIETTPVEVDTNVFFNHQEINFGLTLDFLEIGTYTANGLSHGFWKTNIDKAIKGTTKGVQVSLSTLTSYISVLSKFALSPLNITTLSQASSYLSYSGPDPIMLLSKQLIASEFNYANGAFINNNSTLTSLFLYYGEFMIKHPSNFTSSETYEMKNWYDAYNNTHGGTFIF